MKKPVIAMLAIAILVLSFPVNTYAGPALVSIVFEDFSDYDELRYMADNVTDEQLSDFLHVNRQGGSYYRAGLTDREAVLEFIGTVGHALIPVLPASEDVIWEISIPRGESEYPGDQEHLVVNYWYPEREAILFYSMYGYERDRVDEHLAFIMESNPGTFDVPTSEIDGVKIYQLIDYYLCDFVILIDDYLLWSIHQDRDTSDEKLEEILKFSFVRLDGNESAENTAMWLRYVLFAAVGVFVIGAIMVIFIKRRKG